MCVQHPEQYPACSRCSTDYLWNSHMDCTFMFSWCIHVSVSPRQFESRNCTYSSSRALCLTKVLRNVWGEDKARLACGESIVEARESFPCFTVICIKSRVYGQNLILWLCNQVHGNPRMLWHRKDALILPTPSPLPCFPNGNASMYGKVLMKVFISQKKCLTVMMLIHLLIAKLPMQENTSRKEKLKKKKRKSRGLGEEKEKKAGDVKTILIIL